MLRVSPVGVGFSSPPTMRQAHTPQVRFGFCPVCATIAGACVLSGGKLVVKNWGLLRRVLGDKADTAIEAANADTNAAAAFRNAVVNQKGNTPTDVMERALGGKLANKLVELAQANRG